MLVGGCRADGLREAAKADEVATTLRDAVRLCLEAAGVATPLSVSAEARPPTVSRPRQDRSARAPKQVHNSPMLDFYGTSLTRVKRPKQGKKPYRNEFVYADAFV
jgi:hypothetical protein